MTVHDARRVVRPAKFLGLSPFGALLIGLLSTAGAASLAEDPAAVPAKPAFEAGDISIGEPIALPFVRPKSAPEAAAAPTAATTAASAAPGQGWLGIKVAESTVPGRWTVDEVAPKSPALAAGINPGDEVRAIGGLPLRNADDVAQALTSIAPGQEVRLAIGRGEQVSDVTLTAVPRPPAATKALQSLPLAAPATPPAPPAEPPAAVAMPASAATVPEVAEAPSVSVPGAEALATLPPAPAAENPAASLPAAPPAAAFAAAPLTAPVTAPSVPAEPTSPRFPRASPSTELPAPAADRFEPAATATIAEPPSRTPQAAATTVGRIALGVRTIPIDTGLQARFNLPAAAGAYVIGVVGDLPASRAGVPPGSVIVALDERPVRSPDELTRLVTNGPVGKPVPLQYVLPGGASRRADVVLQALEQPLEEALVGPPSPTAVGVPTLETQPVPTTARKPSAAAEATLLRDQMRRLEARLEALEQRLSDR